MGENHNQNVHFTLGTGTSLSELDAESLAAISQAAVRRSYDKGQFVALEGEPCPGLLIVESGLIASTKISPQGREQEIRLVGPGELINEISIMVGDTNLVTLKTLSDSVVWVIEPDQFKDLMSKHQDLHDIITHNLARLVVQLVNVIEDLSLRNVEGRLANLILNQSENGVFHRKMWLTQEEMAARVGTTSVVVSRTLNEMQNQGAIRLEHNLIRILNHEILASVVYRSQK